MAWHEILSPILAERRRILWFTALITLMTLFINFFVLSPYYRASVVLLPDTESGSLSFAGQFSEIARFADLSGISTEIVRLYPAIAASNTVLERVVQKEFKAKDSDAGVNLIQFFEFGDEEAEEGLFRAVEELRSFLSHEYDSKTNLLTFTLEMTDPVMAADVLNAVIEDLDRFMRSGRATNASERVGWIEERLEHVKDSLTIAEEALRAFRARNRSVSNSPDLLLQQERLRRDVELASTVYIELSRQLELARLEEVNSSPVLHILDSAVPPFRKVGPRRLLNTLAMMILTIVVSSVYYVSRARYGTELSEFLQRVRSKPGKPM